MRGTSLHKSQSEEDTFAPAIDLSVGRAAFDPTYNHVCPVSIYKSRRDRNSRYGFRFD